MHPINNSNFGTLGIKVQFTDNSTIVSGSIVKQIGTSTFVVTDNAGTVETVKLAANLSDVAALPPGTCTIPVTAPDGSAQHVRSIFSVTLFTVEGNKYSWTLTEGTAGNPGTLVLANILKP